MESKQIAEFGLQGVNTVATVARYVYVEKETAGSNIIVK
jgi:hypothetical protein